MGERFMTPSCFARTDIVSPGVSLILAQHRDVEVLLETV